VTKAAVPLPLVVLYPNGGALFSRSFTVSWKLMFCRYSHAGFVPV
jgi:hypothetical protein